MSLSAAVLEKMMEKGLTIADAVEIARLLEEGAAKPPPSSQALRQRRYRERKCGEGITRDVTVTRNGDAERVSPTPPSEITPFPPLKGGTSPTNLESDFERWWSSYPKKVGKGQARKAYSAALRKTDAENLQRSLDRARFDADQRFVPNPATWLNGERWLDGIESDGPPEEPEDPWEGRVRRWRISGYWDSDWGPRPDKPGCLVPPHLIEGQPA